MAALDDPTTGPAGVPVVTQYEVQEQVAEGPPPEGVIGASEPAIDDAAAGDATPAIPLVPVPVMRGVFGRYRSAGSGFQLELRVDVDGARPLNRVSGDFFSVSGGSTIYYGSFRVDAPTITTTATQVDVEGTGTFTWSTARTLVRVTIPRVTILQPAAAATVQFLTPPSTPGATYTCPFASTYFRTIVWEQDHVAGHVPFVSYNTASLPLPAGAPTGMMDVTRAYGLAGCRPDRRQARRTSSPSRRRAWTRSGATRSCTRRWSPTSRCGRTCRSGGCGCWSPTEHVGGYRGIMFDSLRHAPAAGRGGLLQPDRRHERGRQASAAAHLRARARATRSTCCTRGRRTSPTPPQPLGAQRRPGRPVVDELRPELPAAAARAGREAAYWAAFPFQFTNNELVHLRHAFYRNVDHGRRTPSASGAAEIDPDQFEAPIEDRSGLALEVRPQRAYAYGEPVVVELKLVDDRHARHEHARLPASQRRLRRRSRSGSPRAGPCVYRPLLRHCADEHRPSALDAVAAVALRERVHRARRATAAYFDQPGRYTVRASYVAADGSRIVSPVTELRVRRPMTAADEEAASC